MYAMSTPLVTTIPERCRVCYTCVRECPAKAIRISDRQAEVIPQRCIACGNCVRVCSQKAKRVADDTQRVRELLAGPHPVAACLAPSFPAEFVDIEPEMLVGMLRALGFAKVTEVAFGADLVAAEYGRLLRKSDGQRRIATSCPAIIGFVERYHPDMVEHLAPVVSPMIAMGRIVHYVYGPEMKTVFIGPCIAKKAEAASRAVRGDVDVVLTFRELRRMLREVEAGAEPIEPSDFDPPHPGTGALFPIARGMLQAARIDEDLLTGEVLAADGRSEFVEALREFETGDLNVELLEALCCNGCVAGAGMSSDAPFFRRRAQVSRYVRRRMSRLQVASWQQELTRIGMRVNLQRNYQRNDQRVAAPSDAELRQILIRLGKARPDDELNCGACGYETCRDHAIAIYKGLAENEMCLPHVIEALRRTCSELSNSNQQLASTQEALMQSEKLASMGQLAAGIAHEVNNPLGTVLMLAHVLCDECESDSELHYDLAMIASEADRCQKIVSGLLHFARKNRVDAQRMGVADLIDSLPPTPMSAAGVQLIVEHDDPHLDADLDRDQILQVLVNLIGNAVAAMPEGGVLTLHTGGDESRIFVEVKDTGIGIPKENVGKIFEPFFTTKPAGEGTGLGLSVSYGIVKMHHGDLTVQSNADPANGPTGATFRVELPRRRIISGAS